MDECKIVSLNVRGIRDEQKRKQIFAYMRNIHADIVVLQETHSVQEDVRLWKKQWGQDAYFSHSSTKSGGTCILINNNNGYQTKSIACDKNGRYVIVEVTDKDRTYLIVNVYRPNIDDPDFYTKLYNEINNLEGKELIVVGDFNLVLDPTLDWMQKVIYHPQARKIVLKIMDEMELLDLWRIDNPQRKIYSWTRKYKNRISGSRIDLALMSQSIANKTKSIKYVPGFKSDHSMIEIKLLRNDAGRGRGSWKFNLKLLCDM